MPETDIVHKIEVNASEILENLTKYFLSTQSG